MKTKSAYQKMYEKLRAISLRPEELTVMFAERSHNGTTEPGLYVCLKNVPLAKLLPKSELDETSPDFDRTRIVQECFEKMMKLDPRDSKSGFDLIVGDGFEEEFVRSVDDICAG